MSTPHVGKQPAKSLIPMTSHPRLLTAAYYLAFVVLGFSTGTQGPTLPTLAAHTSSSLDRISLLFVVGSFGYVLGSLAGGYLYDRLRGHRIMSAGLALMIGAAVVFPLASTLWLLLVAGFAMGFGSGTVDVGGNTLLQWVHGPASGPYLNGLHFAFGLGSFFSPILLAQVLARTHDIYWVYWAMPILIVPLIAWLWFLREPAVPAHAAATHEARPPLVPVLLIVLGFCLYVGAEVGFANWLYTYSFSLKLADEIQAAYLTSAFWALFTVGRLLAVWIASRARPRTILFFDFAGAMISVAIIGLASRSALALWVGSMAYGLSLASIFPTMLLLAAERLRVTGTITGWFLLGSGAGGMLLPWLIGIAFTSLGPHAMVPVVFIDIALNACVLWAFVHTAREPAIAPIPASGP